ncbi:MAG: hypothetical protein H6624_11895 [Bdellovibrionaceae bacterium]|nr:hypothetical protein [Bdellovibrionales bacterium]MCB9085043.1 hypothetical protein [Pseudobdellovibrionaceae bacterium]
MVAKVAQPREIIQWLQKSWRIFRKRPFYLCGAFILFALGAIMPSYLSPFARVFSGFILPIMVAGSFIMIFRILRYKAISWWDLFLPFSESRLAVRLMPVCFLSLVCWVSIGAVEYMYRQPIKYQMSLEFHNTVVIISTLVNMIFLFGVTPILIFSPLNFIQAIALTVRAIFLNPVLVLIVWGGGILIYDISFNLLVPYIPIGAFLMVMWFNAFDGLFLITDDPIASSLPTPGPKSDDGDSDEGGEDSDGSEEFDGGNWEKLAAKNRGIDETEEVEDAFDGDLTQRIDNFESTEPPPEKPTSNRPDVIYEQDPIEREEIQITDDDDDDPDGFHR